MSTLNSFHEDFGLLVWYTYTNYLYVYYSLAKAIRVKATTPTKWAESSPFDFHLNILTIWSKILNTEKFSTHFDQ